MILADINAVDVVGAEDIGDADIGDGGLIGEQTDGAVRAFGPNSVHHYIVYRAVYVVVGGQRDEVVVAGALQVPDKPVAAAALKMHPVHIPQLRTALGVVKADVFHGEILDERELRAVDHRIAYGHVPQREAPDAVEAQAVSAIGVEIEPFGAVKPGTLAQIAVKQAGDGVGEVVRIGPLSAVIHVPYSSGDTDIPVPLPLSGVFQHRAVAPGGQPDEREAVEPQLLTGVYQQRASDKIVFLRRRKIDKTPAGIQQLLYRGRVVVNAVSIKRIFHFAAPHYLIIYSAVCLCLKGAVPFISF